ncbi:MAG: TIGR02757 family protein [Deltaproteobacteria bacterium]|nr:TIGR02757 family protein [Deltaproteobacteria bacterium]
MQKHKITTRKINEIFALYHHRKFVHPDPLEFLYDYPELRDRELVGLIASSLAYGRVAQILKSVSSILDRMDDSPYDFVLNTSSKNMMSLFADFRHRFTSGESMTHMLLGARGMILKYGSLYQGFLDGFDKNDETILPALSIFTKKLSKYLPDDQKHLIACPDKGSACKRLNLFLRWMVREDDVDPGGWGEIPPSKLIIPLDVHMHRIGQSLQLTSRKQADMRTALEITETFKKISPEDPVRYDFSLTRMGIRNELDELKRN